MSSKFPLIQNGWLELAFNQHDAIKLIVKDMFNAKSCVSIIKLSDWKLYKDFYYSITNGLIEIKPIGETDRVFVGCQVFLNVDFNTLSIAEYVMLRDKINEL